IVSTVMLSDGWSWSDVFGRHWGFVPLSLRLAAYVVVLLAIGLAYLFERRSLPPAIAVAAMTLAVPWLRAVVGGDINGSYWGLQRPTALMYATVGATCVFLAWWGVQQASKAIVN